MKYIDNKMLKKIFLGAATYLENNKSTVDALNVFPVPDGDTGTNMNLTVQSAIKEINNLSESSIEKIALAAANGSLMGARGNSGVILSQLFRGLAKELRGKDKIDTRIMAESFKSATDTAYKAVMKPVEGTILTVARESAEKSIEISENEDNVVIFLEDVIKKAKKTLEKTPEMLEVLKQAGVVDAGGKGLIYLLEGALLSLKGIEIKKEEASDYEIQNTDKEILDFVSEDEILFTYCTEFIINNTTRNYKEFLSIIEDKGDSIVCVGGEGIIKVHIHTNDPGLILSKAVKFGELINLKIENMKAQYRELSKKPVSTQKKKYGFVAVGMGDGIKKVFKDLKVDTFITGGQTMNPSTEDILSATKEINAEHIIILPNNSNIILTANQAKEISEKDINVINTKTIPQGIASMLAFNEELSIDENVSNMEEAIKDIKTGQVTFAVRDTVINDLEIKKDNIISLFDGQIVAHGDKIEEQTLELIEKMIDEDSYLITIFYGKDIDKEEVTRLTEKVEEIAEDCDIEFIYGGQPLYYYIISVE